MGSRANARANIAKQFNTIRGLLPNDVQDLLPSFDASKVANWEAFNKQTTQLGFALAKQLGSREAMQIVQSATAAVPNAEQTYWGARLVASSMRQAAQRQIDYHQYVSQLQRQGKSLLFANDDFNQRHPPQEYTAKALSVVPPQRAISFLQANPTPQNRKAFDQKYGDGASNGVFGTQ